MLNINIPILSGTFASKSYGPSLYCFGLLGRLEFTSQEMLTSQKS